MREIKFRAWDIENKEMVKVHQINWENEGYLSISHNGIWHADVDNYILMQYTGLKDKNGVEIYEGDIIMYWRDESDYIGEVILWSAVSSTIKAYGFAYSKEKKIYRYFKEPAYFEIRELHLIETEIIGNIYENPELLEVSK